MLCCNIRIRLLQSTNYTDTNVRPSASPAARPATSSASGASGRSSILFRKHLNRYFWV